ncbi:MAG: outer membrane protein assembly factor BamB family protein [Planctomycetota bacterium]|jgi:outer membrane protein assembly factor BamB
MSNPQPTGETEKRKSIRLWPGVAVVTLQWLLWLVLPSVVPGDEAIMIGVFGGLLGGLAVFVWWAFFSRAPRLERFGAVVLMIFALVAALGVIDKSIATGNLGMMYFIYAVPVLSLAFVVWAAVGRHLSVIPRRASMVATILLACGGWAFVRSDGISGTAKPDFKWRWAETAEEQLLAQSGEETMVLPSTAALEANTGADWPGFRGPNRDSIARGLRIATDWSASPPVELWRRAVGPGCSSFAARGELIYTQEQRGEDEAVTCYYLKTGVPAWIHRDKARFWDSHAGAGPRGTPTLGDGHVYTLGGTGILNVLDARDGSVVWSRNVATETKTKIPEWGIASSPLLVGDLVIVAAKGTLAAYDRATGSPRWSGPNGGKSYSSPHLLAIDGVKQVLHMMETGAAGFAPADGTILWKHPWPGADRVVQPAMTAEGDLLLCGGGLKLSMRRFSVTQGTEGWKVEERWASRGLKPNHNDSIVHKGHAYGFISLKLACIDVKDGARKWKGARYAGFTILLADQDVLLVLSEKGEVALVEAVPDRFRELAKFKAIEGKTWNHPALAGDVLLVRNAREMAAFRLPLKRD